MHDLVATASSVGLLPLALWVSGAIGIYLLFLPIDHDFPRSAKDYMARTIFSPVTLIDVRDICARYVELIKWLLRSRTFRILTISIAVPSPLRTALATLAAFISTIFVIILVDQKPLIERAEFLHNATADEVDVAYGMIKSASMLAMSAFLANFAIDFLSYTKTVNILNSFTTGTTRSALVYVLIDVLVTIVIVWSIMAIFNLLTIIIGNILLADYITFPLMDNLRTAVIEFPLSGLNDFIRWCGSVLYGKSLLEGILPANEANDTDLFLVIIALAKYVNIIVYLTSFWILLLYVIFVFLSIVIAIINRYSPIHMAFIKYLEPEERPFRAIGIVCSIAWLVCFWPLYLICA